jgi:hypothetical protein
MKRALTIAALAATLLFLLGMRPSLGAIQQELEELFAMLSELDSDTDAAVANLAAGDDEIVEAICDAADVRGDSYRPFVCEPRCGCPEGVAFADLGLAACTEASPGTFVAIATAPSVCVANRCSGSASLPCSPANPSCPGDFVCRNLSAGGPIPIPNFRCVRPCETDAECPAIETASVSLASVADPGVNSVVTCSVQVGGSSAETTINNPDARACLEEIEALTGACS